MRVAWLGPEPTLDGGVTYAATQILRELTAQGVDVDAYVVTTADGPADPLAQITGAHVIEQRTGWNWDRWYSRTALGVLASGQLTRLRAQRALLARLVAAHAGAPYDVIYQFSQFETGWLRGREDVLPPVVVHPEVHAAGELRWLRLEADLARRCESAARRAGARSLMRTRSELQRRDSRRVAAFIAPSRVFAAHLAEDYRISARSLHVVANPIDLERFHPPANGRPPREHDTPVELLFVSRLAVRKGLEMIAGLSHRLRDEAGRVRLTVLGDRGLFSDYRCLLADLHPGVAAHEGYAHPPQLVGRYQAADGLLVPSHYEPFGLTVGEALACGLPVVASSEVGAAEGVDARACRTFAAGDLDAFEAAVRTLIADLRRGARRELAVTARGEAARLFSPALVAGQVAAVLQSVGRP